MENHHGLRKKCVFNMYTRGISFAKKFHVVCQKALTTAWSFGRMVSLSFLYSMGANHC